MDKRQYLANDIQQEIEKTMEVYEPERFRKDIMDKVKYIEEDVDKRHFPKPLNVAPLD